MHKDTLPKLAELLFLFCLGFLMLGLLAASLSKQGVALSFITLAFWAVLLGTLLFVIKVLIKSAYVKD